MRAFAFMVVLSMVLLSTATLADVPSLMNYQGTLTDQYGVALDDTVSLTFAIYTEPEGGTPLWAETQTSVVVSQGVFNVLLGSVSPLGDDVFAEPNRWLGITVFDEPEMQPRQQIVTVGYAFRAAEADTADVARGGGGGGGGWVDDGTVVRLETITDSVGIGTNTPHSKFSLGTGLNAKKFALWDGVDDFYGLGIELGRITFYTNNTEKMTIYNNGRVGIGTTTPAAKLAVRNEGVADVNINSDTSYAVIRLRKNGIDKWAWSGEWLSNRTSIYSYDLGGNVLVIENTGEVGIGTETPSEELDVVGTIKSASSDGRAVDGLTSSSNEWVPAIYGRNEGAGDGVYGWSQSRHGTFGITYSSNTDHAGVFGQNSGGGIGVYGQTTTGEGVKGKATGNGFGGWFRADGSTGTGVHASCLGTSGIGIYAEGGTSGLAALFKGNVRIASKSTGSMIIELGEGLDYAEGFDVTNAHLVEPGTVLIIDPDHPGQLKSCDSPYDSKVAGIVAGAKNQGSGVRLGSDQFDHDVALAGRVYCNVDATYGQVVPGDLLTTSPTPGYAMVVGDHDRAHGAILGKAMEGLEIGERGQILVLVTLQ